MALLHDAMNIDSYYQNVIAQLTSQGEILQVSNNLRALKDNGKRVLYVYDVLETLGPLPSVIRVGKCEEVAVYYRNHGNECFKTKDDYLAWQYYNLSLLYAPSGTEAYSLALSNRSAVFLSLKKYKECLKDIKCVLSLKYPNKLKEKLLNRQALCDVELRKEQLSDDDVAKMDVDDILEVKGPKDDKYLCASSKLQVVYSKDMGRHVIAREDIKVGECLVQEDPYFVLLMKSQFLFYCYYCLSKNLNLLPCDGCCFVLYCSEECKEKAWKEYHAIECQLMATLIQLKFSKLELLAIRTVIKARCDHSDWNSLISTIEETELNLNNELRGLLKVNDKFIYDSKHYTAIHTLATNVEKRSVSDIFLKSVTAAVYLKLLSDVHFVKIDDNKENKVLNCVAGLLLLHIMTSPTNMHSISATLQNADGKYIEEVSIGSAPYAFLSLINHSCNPNVFRTEKLGSAKMSLIAIRPIKKGMQVYDNYGSHHATEVRAVRQKYLYDQYKFRCHCEACENDWPQYFYHKPAKNLPNDVSKQKLQLLNSDNLDKLQIGDVETARKLIKPLCDFIYKVEPYIPCTEVADGQEYLKQCIAILCGMVHFGYSKLVQWEEHFVNVNRRFSNLTYKK